MQNNNFIRLQYKRHKMSSSTTPKNLIKLIRTNQESPNPDKMMNKPQKQRIDSSPNVPKQTVAQQNQQVSEAKNKLDNLIQDLNDKLVNHFKMKQQALLNQYKQQLIEQQKKLNQLKNTTNQQQIRAKMLERKAELERQRNHLIQTNMFFSQKCEQYKQTYTKLVQQSKDLQKQIQFLDHQIQAATAKRFTLVDEIGSATQRTENLQLYTHKKNNILPQIQATTDKHEKSTLQKSHNTHSVRKIAQSLHVGSDNKHKKSSSTKNFQKIDKGVFNKSTIEKIFEQSVQQIKNRRKTKRTMPNLKGEQFTQYQKRAIMQIFLGNQEVKRKLYEIIFSQNDKNYRRPLPVGEKVKISFDQLGI